MEERAWSLPPSATSAVGLWAMPLTSAQRWLSAGGAMRVYLTFFFGKGTANARARSRDVAWMDQTSAQHLAEGNAPSVVLQMRFYRFQISARSRCCFTTPTATAKKLGTSTSEVSHEYKREG